uniref:Protein kinase domain-containing protein n=1 Tax=Caenorhabditis japonica TaxID=281687 RepID=A0A8R1INV8_CAEJA
MLDAEIYDFMKCTLKIDPKKRISAEEVLKMPVFDVLRALPRKQRSNGVEVPDLTKYVDMNPKRGMENEDGVAKETRDEQKAKEKEKYSESSDDDDD